MIFSDCLVFETEFVVKSPACILASEEWGKKSKLSKKKYLSIGFLPRKPFTGAFENFRLVFYP